MLENILKQDKFTKEDIKFLLGLTDENDRKKLFKAAQKVKLEHIGDEVYYRGLIEQSNLCVKDCLYCGIRKSLPVERYELEFNDVVESAVFAFEQNYGSIAIQTGERQDKKFIDLIERILIEIKKRTNGKLGVTLSLGEQTYETYKRWHDAGAHRYLLRIESSSRELYYTLHPNDDLHNYDKRLQCLRDLERAGYQVGTGFLIGVPGQTLDNLANDILFLKEWDIDMVGMGPYVIQKNTPTGEVVLNQDLNTPEKIKARYDLAINMIAVARVVLKDVNIASTTALQALSDTGREDGINAGANILMPLMTLAEHRKKYQLYDDKPFSSAAELDLKIGYGKWGDSPHFANRQKNKIAY